MPKKKAEANAPWKRVIIQRSVLAGYSKGPKPVKKLAKALKGQQTQSAYYEKLKDRDGLASARLNEADRALLVEFEVNGEKSLVIADIAENHEYKKSPLFSDKAGVEKYRQKYGPSIIRQIEELMAEEALEAARPAAGPVQKTRPLVTLDYYNQRVIRLSSQQEEILKVRPPVVIRGAAGSGKSCLAVSRILELIASLPPDSAGKILYVTQSPELVKAMQAIWDSLSLPETLKNRVEFKAYETVAREQQSADFEGKRLAVKEDFEQWLKDYVGKCRDRLKPAAAAAGKKGKGKKKKAQVPDDANAQLDRFLKEGHELYQEFRLLSGYFLPEGYLGLGTQNSLYAHQDDRQWILAAYENYQNYLKDQRLVALDFLKFKPRDPYDLVLGDEAQDLSGLELENLLLLAKEGQLCLCMDTHQSLFDELSKGPLIENMMQRYGLALASVELPHSYRCPENVVHFANEVIKVKNQVVGGRADKHELSEIKMSPEQAKTPGIVHWLKQSPEELKTLRDMAKQSNFAIITLPEYKKEAQEKYPGAVLVFTAEEIKGLEYENVILYRMLDNDLCREASREWTDGKVPTNRVKRGCGDSRFGPPLNKFFTSSTRATKRLFIDQGDDYPLAPLCNAFKKGIKTPETAFLSDPNLEQTEAERLAQWEEEICRLYQNGKKDMAKNAFDRSLKNQRSYADYDDFLLTKGLIKKEEPPVEKQEEVEAVETQAECPVVAAEPSKPAEAVQEEQAPLSVADKKQSSNRRSNRRNRGNQAATLKTEPKETTASLSRNSQSLSQRIDSLPTRNTLGRSPKFFDSGPGEKFGLPGSLEEIKMQLMSVANEQAAYQDELMNALQKRSSLEEKGAALKAQWASLQQEKQELIAGKPRLSKIEEKIQTDLNNLFNSFTESTLDNTFKKKHPQETIFRWLLLTENGGNDCFISRLKGDNDKWMALKRYFINNPLELEHYFSLKELAKRDPRSGNTYFEILCLKQHGLDFLKEIWDSMSVPEMLDSATLFAFKEILFAAAPGNTWDDLIGKNNVLMYLLNHPTGRPLLKILFSSPLFPTLCCKDKEENTLLHWAVSNQRVNIIIPIMAARASALKEGFVKEEQDVFGMKNKEGLTPLELAKKLNLHLSLNALDCSRYENPAPKKENAPVYDEQYLRTKIQEISTTRGPILIPAVKQLSGEINDLEFAKTKYTRKLLLNKNLTKKGERDKNKLNLRIRVIEGLIKEKQKQQNEEIRDARLMAVSNLTRRRLSVKEIYENLDMLTINIPPDLLYTFLMAAANPNDLPLLMHLFKNNSDGISSWKCFQNYLEENPVLVNFNFSLDELFRQYHDLGKTRFELLARRREGLDFLYLIFTILSIPEKVTIETHRNIMANLFADIAIKQWGSLEESQSLLMYLLNRVQGRFVLSKLPADLLFNLISQQDSQWNSLLHWAAANQRADLISMVLELKQRMQGKASIQQFIDLKNEAGETALDIAKAHNFAQGITLLTGQTALKPGLASYSSLYHSPVTIAAGSSSSSAALTETGSVTLS
ncbi:UvrD-helicase domain-containing protein [Legionella quinlivanii]|uniref:UvrD-helicase domain-containing protein n=2 Tax=Legionella quinlivanii TaxID=45073 RepID=UPI0010565B3C|nr:UvrD-helicase domain-containing protein [Legionella quinlivanii]